MDQVGLKVAPATIVQPLGAGQKQLIQIARALARDARLLLLDEPTSCLSQHEALHLQTLLRAFKARGLTVVYVSHKLEDVLALCDRVSVLRDGRHVGTRSAAVLSKAELVHLMIGREERGERQNGRRPDDRREMLRVAGLTKRGSIHDIGFTLHRGEILGFYGLVGSGRTETARLIVGADRPDAGAVCVRGRRVVIRGVRDALRRHRIGYVSENRKEEGLLLDTSVAANITITIWDRLAAPWTRCLRAGGNGRSPRVTSPSWKSGVPTRMSRSAT